MRRFENKVALITGAASGIGRETARRLAEEGASVFCVDLQVTGLQETAQLIRDAGGVAEVHQCDVTSEEQVSNCVVRCVEVFGQLDHVSNMAGILRFDHFHELTLADFEQVMRVNVTGVYLVCREAIPHLLKTRGNIVNAASTSALAGVPWAGVYSASKGAVLAMSRTMAVEYATQGLRVNCVCPGDIKTPMASPSFPQDVDLSMLERCMSITGTKGPEVVAGVIAMLASEDGAHITGEDVRMDGGTLS
jgi:meso-butanediol dehydrogenase/(S,S)-butanediol dehydrogenase/diacetyl reductase